MSSEDLWCAVCGAWALHFFALASLLFFVLLLFSVTIVYVVLLQSKMELQHKNDNNVSFPSERDGTRRRHRRQAKDDTGLQIVEKKKENK
jgi:heme exporter protein D